MSNKALKVLFLSNGVFVFANNLLGPLYAIFAEKFDSNVFSISASWSLFMISATFFTYLVKKYGDRIKENEYLLLIGYVIRILCWIGYIFIASFWQLLVIQVILGISEAVSSPAFDTIFAKHLDKNKEIDEYATWKIYEKISIALSTLIGGFIVQYASFDLLFVSMSLVATFSVIYIYKQDRELL